MKRTNLPILLAAAALCAAPALAQEPGAAAPVPPPAPPAFGGHGGRPLPRVMPSGPKFDALSPEEQQHIRRMADFRAARDAAERDILRLRESVAERRKVILAENEEAKALFEDSQRLFEEYSAKTNALQAILENDETISGLFKAMEPAKQLVESNQRSLNAEAVAAFQRRMREQREKAEAEGFVPPALEPVPDQDAASATAEGEKSEAVPAAAPVATETDNK